MKTGRAAIFLLFMGCQVSKTVKTETETFADGKIKTIRQNTIKKNREFELHENFRAETRITREYFHNGKLKMKMKVVYLTGMDISCREALYKLEQYDSTGIKRYLLETECDCHRSREITYNTKGKMLSKSKTVVKRLY